MHSLVILFIFFPPNASANKSFICDLRKSPNRGIGRFYPTDSIYRLRALQFAAATRIRVQVQAQPGSHASAGHVNL